MCVYEFLRVGCRVCRFRDLETERGYYKTQLDVVAELDNELVLLMTGPFLWLNHADYQLVDVALATSAAPTYFPPHQFRAKGQGTSACLLFTRFCEFVTISSFKTRFSWHHLLRSIAVR